MRASTTARCFFLTDIDSQCCEIQTGDLYADMGGERQGDFLIMYVRPSNTALVDMGWAGIWNGRCEM